jgi:hypothetical protein
VENISYKSGHFGAFFSLKSFEWIAMDFFFGEKILKIHQKGKFTLIFDRFNLAFGGY